MSDPSKINCPTCGKEVRKTKAGAPWHHKCEPGDKREEQISPIPTDKVTPDLVVAKFIEDRDKLSVMKREYEEKVQEIKDLQTKRENYLQGIMNQNGLEKIGTVAGTAFIDWKDFATVDDGEKFKEWVVGDWIERKHFLENRVSKAAVKQYHEKGKLSPPGVSYKRIKGIKIRRK